MPYIIGRPHKRILALVAASLTMMVAASPAAADTGCPTPPTSPVLAQFGDTANYTLLQGGNFEGNMAGWSLNKASVVSGNESFYVGSTTDSNSLSIPGGGSATSPAFCASSVLPTYRLFVKNTSNSPNATLTASVVYSGVNGNSATPPAPVALSTTNGSWQLTAPLNLGSALNNGQTVNAQLVFTASAGSTWQIDDVYIDPYAR
jgi:hypothetical protein